MTRHSPLIRLQATRAELDAACEACPHDDEGHGRDHDCCYREQDARKAHRIALAAYHASESK